ncbi:MULTISPECIES: cytochrome-c peroxidase [Azospirillum]|uniref:Cytochrome-c peroxidase n=2 Tax=Azospirillum brasilense TaxID=192 RepID=A0ABU4P514_AZOBR|nr:MULTISPECIES: cytochrome-c peroxidase [Azospirillum]ALJ36283.1 cytochrome C biogenesis protein CcsA [Azospirillum brasilense]MDW7557475.1 cytochrome-c peroxidase [Azospirillum brasilense]MDW7597112.1 cytochrome-c peroxidase [Azospirillum brasilense]MDW7632247.1 cytochrome-c peroxidase [Azospirillum brasilense]MDX5952371.1 cytochrome-c peroxidase [Azospirillum brasilense]
MSMRAAVSFAAMLAASVATFGVPAFAADEPISPIEPAKVTNPGLVELGKKLYFDPRLSKSGFISCNSCHNLSMGGTDNLKTSVGHNWQQGPINSPTVLNSSLNVAQFWDGRALTLQEQAGGPIANPGEMGSTHALAVEVLRSIPEYQKEFAEVFGETTITIEEVTKAIAAFEETLVTPNSRFDQWLKGDKKALTTVELEGYELFKDSGCTACHNGSAVGGNTFQKMGVVEPYKTNNPAEGRIAVTKEEADRFNFKVPTLRNVALTYPYFHDGEAATLSDAVDVMGRIQLGKKFSPDENAKIVAFLKTLTGDQPSFALPILPPSTDKTPKPHPFD